MAYYPQAVTLGDTSFQFEQILKEDFFSVNVLYRSESGDRKVLKLSDFRFLFGILFRPLAGFMSRHELKMYQKLGDIPGVPAAGPRFGRRGFFHDYVEGETLFALEERREAVSGEFFEHLLRMMQAIHQRNIIYLDSNKLGNVIVGTDGLPRLIDYQISINFGRARRVTGWLFDILVREDIYHVYKHKRNFGHALTPEESKLGQRSKINNFVGVGIGRPYRWLKRKIYPSGGGDVIWYKKRKSGARDTD